MGVGRWDFPNRNKRGDICDMEIYRGGKQKNQERCFVLKKVYQRYDGLLKMFKMASFWVSTVEISGG